MQLEKLQHRAPSSSWLIYIAGPDGTAAPRPNAWKGRSHTGARVVFSRPLPMARRAQLQITEIKLLHRRNYVGIC